MSTQTARAAVPSAVLAKATLRAAEFLGLRGEAIGEVIGLSEATMSRIRSGQRGIDPQDMDGKLALLLVRLFRSLDALVGNDDRKGRLWMESYNRALNGVPGELIKNPEGLVRAVQYLDGLRAPL